MTSTTTRSTATSLTERLVADADRLYAERETELGEELMRALERYLLLQIIDERWREHLYDMDYLREGIHLRGFAQIEPIVAYKNEAFDLFTDLMTTIWSDFARMIFNVQVQVEAPDDGGPAAPAATAAPVQAGRKLDSSGERLLLLRWAGRRAERSRRGRGCRGSDRPWPRRSPS